MKHKSVSNRFYRIAFLIYLFAILAIVLMAGFGLDIDEAEASNIDSSDKWAWNDVVGWIDFYDSDNGAVVISSQVQRWAVLNTDSDEYIALDCNTLPPSGSSDCTPDFGVDNSSGTLSGYAWSDAYGWISFNCSDEGICGTSNYSVSIDDAGNWSGWAWNDVIGWISFNCADDSLCGTSDYKVASEWTTEPPCPTCAPEDYLESETFDTQETNGFVFNSVYWDGTFPTDAKVGFQFAVSNSTSTGWTDSDFKGSDGTSSTIYEASSAGETIPLIGNYHNPFQDGYRYYRYRVYLDQFNATTPPSVTKIVVNWSQ